MKITITSKHGTEVTSIAAYNRNNDPKITADQIAVLKLGDVVEHRCFLGAISIRKHGV